MKAVVLAAGLGTRLGGLTSDRAKVSLTVGRRPIVAHVASHLLHCGFDKIAVNLHYQPEQVRSALVGVSADIVWFEEPELLGTAGALGPMRDFLDGDDAFLVQYGDVLTDHNLASMLARHRERGALLTMLVHQRPDSNSLVEVGADSSVRSFFERPSAAERATLSTPWVNSGVYVFSSEILALLPPAPSDVARDLVPQALAAGRVFAEQLEGFRCAIDSPERLEVAELALATGRWKPS